MSSRKKISKFTDLELWVKAGARCQFQGCNEYLLGDRLTNIQPLNLADRAHIVGQSIDGPRGDNGLQLSERDKVENLMLLCPKCHKLIDKKKNHGKFSVERLKKFKADHEKMIFFHTGIKPGYETTIIRLRSKIRGEIVGIPEEQIWEAVFTEADRYPRYIAGNNDVEIDLTSFSEGKTYWQSGIEKINETMDKLYTPGIETKAIKHISVFALARIPFLIHLGSRLTDKIPTDIYQKNRIDESWLWIKKSQKPNFELKKIQSGKKDNKVALILSISGKVAINSISSSINKDFTVYEICPKRVLPSRSLIQSKSALNEFRNIYQQFLRKIESSYPKLRKFKLFPAIPVSIGIICGRELLKNVSPAIEVYDMDTNGFNFIMEVSK